MADKSRETRWLGSGWNLVKFVHFIALVGKYTKRF